MTVREINGVVGNGKPGEPPLWTNVTVTQWTGKMELDLSSGYSRVFLTPAEARRLARCLYRTARRVEAVEQGIKSP